VRATKVRADLCAARAATGKTIHARDEAGGVAFQGAGGEARRSFLNAVFGEREFSNDEIEDFVLLRSPGKEGEEFGPRRMYQMRRGWADDIDMADPRM